MTNKRVKIFTVHGTFAHEAQWDNWDANDAPDKPEKERHFINRLSGYLSQNGVRFDQVDHTEFNWSGGNSHEERRTAAMGLKNKVQKILREKEEETGKSYKEIYSGGVFVIGHSHGGTLTRLAMNLWDKGDEFYDPASIEFDELKHDDKCPHCRQRRNFDVSPAEIDRPDGVITFGSPFVHFQKHKKPLIAARLFTKALMFIGLIGVATWYIVKLFQLLPQDNENANGLFDQFSRWLNSEPIASFVTVVWGLALFWLFAIYIPGRLRSAFCESGGKTKKTGKSLIISSMLGLVKYIGLALLIIFYIDFFSNNYTGIWQKVTTTLGEQNINLFWWIFPLIIYWVFALSLPKRFLTLLGGKLDELGTRLPEKYDPPEQSDTTVRYLSYHTPGDEAGLGLGFFGLLTWVLQTMWFTLATALIACIVAILIMLIAAPLGMQEVIWNGLFGFPIKFWNILFPFWEIPLVAPEKSSYILLVLFVSFLIGVLLLLPGTIIGFSILYFVSLWLRGSGLAFGGEQISWTMAAKIGANTRPSRFAKMRRMTISPQAWAAGEMAHCYFYKSNKVIKDVADHIADWPNMVQPSRENALVSFGANTLRWLVVCITVISLFLLITKMTNEATIGDIANSSNMDIQKEK